MKDLIIPRSFIVDEESDTFLSVYILVASYYFDSYCEKIYTSPASICHELYGTIKQDKYECIKKDLDYLVSKKILLNVSKYDVYYMTKDSISSLKEKRYIYIDYNNAKKIILSKIKNRFLLVLHYCRMISTMFYPGSDNKISHVSIEYLSNEFGTNSKTIMHMNKQLYELELIYWTKLNGEKETNFYCRWQDKEYMLDFLNVYDNNIILNANHRRSITQKLNQLTKDPSIYSDSEILEIKKEVDQYNSIFRFKYEDTLDDKYKNKIINYDSIPALMVYNEDIFS